MSPKRNTISHQYTCILILLLLTVSNLLIVTLFAFIPELMSERGVIVIYVPVKWDMMEKAGVPRQYH